MSKFNWKPVRSISECDAIITGPGQFHEMEHAIIDGAVYRVYKNLWPSVRDYWLSTVSNQPKIHARDYIVFGDYRLTYLQTDELVQRAASGFREVYHVRKGDRVGIAMRNYPEWVISFFAAGLLGAVPTLLNAWLPAEPLLHCIRLTTPKLLILDSERHSVLSSHLYTLQLTIIIVRPSSPRLPAGPRIKEWSQVMGSYTGSVKAWEKEPDPLPDDNATIFFTSGTTSLPKGVLSTQRQFLGNYFNTSLAMRRRELRLGQDLPPPMGNGPPPEVDIQLGTLVAGPFFHVAASTSQLISATTGGHKMVMMSKWDKEEAARLIIKEKLSTTVGVPTVIYDLLETKIVGDEAFASIAFGGAPAADSLAGELVRKFPNAIIQQGYGLTETNSLSVSVFGEDFVARPGSTGLPFPTVDLLVVDPKTNKVLPTGQTGELWIRGPNVMRGYYNNPKATAEMITRDGWLKSGDLASIDEEGFVYIKDRSKDMIIRGGENIASVSVENALFSDERVLECAVVGVPDKRLGEHVVAIVVPRQRWRGGRLGEAELLRHVKGRLPAFAMPSMIIVQDEQMERNASGKVLKVPLRKLAREAWEARESAQAKL